mmetsp:Transcript_52395/g.104949  ORF Transcript_52395/g.104949 Transcript_52395/m.104949 type:complete len:83 (-) Transcript_52395:771-1019(-)
MPMCNQGWLIIESKISSTCSSLSRSLFSEFVAFGLVPLQSLDRDVALCCNHIAMSVDHGCDVYLSAQHFMRRENLFTAALRR